MSSLNYRRDIDGLRTVALVPVILFHAGVEFLAGGFVGVDVFFVISGFLITSIIARELDAGNFSIWRFYERRARRILPALFFVLAVTTIAAYVIMLPNELADFGKWLNGVIFFVSNIVFWREAGYFEGASELNPLLHTWSLAVEEQFYIFFPPFLWLIWRWRKWAVWLILGVIALGSLLMSDFLSTRLTDANFYLLPTRTWELLCGSLLAIYLIRKPQPTGLLAEALSLGGLIAIITAVAVFSAATPFPSFYALVPVLGTVAVLFAASPQTIVGKMLGWSPIVGLGLISYSAYLWHQPMFAFARMIAPENHPPTAVMLALSVLSLIFAWVSWRFIEAPFRKKDHFSQRQVFIGSAIGGAMFASVGVALFVSNGFVQRYPLNEARILAQSNGDYADYVRVGYRVAINAKLSPDQPNLVIIGDSFSQDFYNVIQETNAFADHAIAARYIPARCQIAFGTPYANVRGFIDAEVQDMCETRSVSQAEVEIIRQADVVIFAARWQAWAADRFGETLAAMDIPNTTQVIVVGPKIFKENRRAILQSLRDQGTTALAPIDPDLVAVNARLKAQAPAGTFVDILGQVCPEGCPLFSQEGEMLSYDGRHLTPAGAAVIGNVLFEQAPLNEFK